MPEPMKVEIISDGEGTFVVFKNGQPAGRFYSETGVPSGVNDIVESMYDPYGWKNRDEE